MYAENSWGVIMKQGANDAVFTGGVLDILYHGSINGGMRRGYHCPVCGKFYVEGEYTIENETHIVGRSVSTVCCGEMLPTPAVYTKAELERTLRNLITDGVRLRSLLIKKVGLHPSDYNPGLIEFFKANPDTRLRVVK